MKVYSEVKGGCLGLNQGVAPAFLQGQIYCRESSLWKADLESASPLHQQKPFALNANPRTRSSRLVGPQRPAPTLSGGEERGRQRETDTLELTARGGTCRGREEPRPAREVDAVTGGPVTCIPGGKVRAKGAGEEEEEGET